MTKTIALPPGVSLQLYEELPKSTIYFDGEGQFGNWADPANWWGGVAPVPTSTVVVPLNATLNGSFVAGTVMLLGTETVTVNGTLTTNNTNLCESFMVCDQAVAVFNPGAALNDAGAIIVGNDDNGTLIAKGAGSDYASLTSVAAKIGRLDGGVGTVTIDGAHWTNSSGMVVGSDGSGTLNVLDGGVVAVGGNLNVGYDEGSTGRITISSGGTVTVGAVLGLGSGSGNPNGEGVANVTINAGGVLTVNGGLHMFTGNTLTLAGGSLVAGPYAAALRVEAGATISGYGTITAATAGVADVGTIVASGGTLMINGMVGGLGTLDIAAGSVLDINAAQLGNVGIDFAGQDGTLMLTHGIADSAVISGFSAGDSIVMAGVDHLAWNASTKILTLSDQGQTVDKMHFAGSYQGNPFALSQSSAGAIITVGGSH